MKDTYLKSKKILIVDDEECLRSMLITILEDENFLNIITADCVKSALEICQQEKPDIAILDVMLPDGNGFELMDALRSFTNIPVIFLDDEIYKYSEEDWKGPILYEGKSVNLYPLSKAICQMDVIKEEPRKIEEVSYEEIVLDKTERGDGKEGSSGK